MSRSWPSASSERWATIQISAVSSTHAGSSSTRSLAPTSTASRSSSSRSFHSVAQPAVRQLLEPVLRRAGANGEKLARRLVNEHHEQRELLKYLLRRLSQYPPTLLIARELQHFAGFLRFEMSQEEATLLIPSVLGE